MKYVKVVFVIFSVVLLVGFILFAVFFYQTGGVGLSRIVVNYLIPNLPNKEYTWQDFTDRGLDKKISGFYSSGDANSFKIWTLSGLKTFYHKPGTSVYMFRDTCAVVKQMKSNSETVNTALNNEVTTSGLFVWERNIKKEYFVTVLRLEHNNSIDYVDKAWSTSGKYKILGQIEKGVCD